MGIRAKHVTMGTCKGCFSKKKRDVFRPDTAQKVQVLPRERLRRKLGSIEQEQEQKEQKQRQNREGEGEEEGEGKGEGGETRLGRKPKSENQEH